MRLAWCLHNDPIYFERDIFEARSPHHSKHYHSGGSIKRYVKLRRLLRCDDKMATTSSMFMYSLTVQPPTAVVQAILGQFAGTKEQQIVTASGSRLTLHRPDPSQGKIITTLSHDVFGIIRAIAAFRLSGGSKGKSYDPLHLIST